MKMTDMKLPKKSSKEKNLCCGPGDMGDAYPYGLRLRFEKEQIAKLPALAEAQADEMVEITCLCRVSEVRVNERKQGETVVKDHTVELQVQQVAIGEEAETPAPAKGISSMA